MSSFQFSEEQIKDVQDETERITVLLDLRDPKTFLALMALTAQLYSESAGCPCAACKVVVENWEQLRPHVSVGIHNRIASHTAAGLASTNVKSINGLLIHNPPRTLMPLDSETISRCVDLGISKMIETSMAIGASGAIVATEAMLAALRVLETEVFEAGPMPVNTLELRQRAQAQVESALSQALSTLTSARS